MQAVPAHEDVAVPVGQDYERRASIRSDQKEDDETQ